MRKEMNLILDLFFYFLFPLVIWKMCRPYFNDYLAIILSYMPGIIYSFYRLFHSRGLNFTRVFLFINIVAEMAVVLLSRSSIQVLWNSAFYSIGLAFLYLTSCFIHKPIFLYFALDILVLQGYDREITKGMLKETNSLNILKLMTVINSIDNLLYALLLIQSISKNGIEAYSYSIIIDQTLSLVISGISVIGFILLYKNIDEIKLVHQMKSNSQRRKKRPIVSFNWYYKHYEFNYFFLSNQRR